MATAAPSAARRCAMAAPMPREPPVMRAVLPASFGVLSVFMMLFFCLDLCLCCGHVVLLVGVLIPAADSAQYRDPCAAMLFRHDGFPSMELRHLRYFAAVAEVLNFTKAAARLRVAQPALSRQVQDLEDEIGVDLLKRSPRGVTLTAEGKLFLAETLETLKRVDDSVEKVRALARGEYLRRTPQRLAGDCGHDRAECGVRRGPAF